ncbi:MAG: hypothetical protein LUB61_03900 [Eggerthellaceae bacterium]|nr:hypothetical protein [Eggerthellaceae bacterium]
MRGFYNPSFAIVALICVVIIVAIIAVVVIVRGRQKQKADEQRRMQQILNQPLETFSDAKLDDLERKYTGQASGGSNQASQYTKSRQAYSDSDAQSKGCGCGCHKSRR